jgi:hypothetical protein
MTTRVTSPLKAPLSKENVSKSLLLFGLRARAVRIASSFFDLAPQNRAE